MKIVLDNAANYQRITAIKCVPRKCEFGVNFCQEYLSDHPDHSDKLRSLMVSNALHGTLSFPLFRRRFGNFGSEQ